MKRNETKLGVITGFVFCLTVLSAFGITVLAQVNKPSSIKSHRHPGMDSTVAVDIPEFSIVETSLEPGLKKENLVRSQDKKHEAFTVSDTRLFVTEVETKKIFEIKGLPLEWRPFSDVTWANNQTLMFDRWSQPHYGVHYSVNVKTRKLVVVAPFGDK